MSERPICEECGRRIPEGEVPYRTTEGDNGERRWKIVCKRCIDKEAADAVRKGIKDE